jgi:hypothetical protein
VGSQPPTNGRNEPGRREGAIGATTTRPQPIHNISPSDTRHDALANRFVSPPSISPFRALDPTSPARGPQRLLLGDRCHDMMGDKKDRPNPSDPPPSSGRHRLAVHPILLTSIQRANRVLGWRLAVGFILTTTPDPGRKKPCRGKDGRVHLRSAPRWPGMLGWCPPLYRRVPRWPRPWSHPIEQQDTASPSGPGSTGRVPVSQPAQPRTACVFAEYPPGLGRKRDTSARSASHRRQRNSACSVLTLALVSPTRLTGQLGPFLQRGEASLRPVDPRRCAVSRLAYE